VSDEALWKLRASKINPKSPDRNLRGYGYSLIEVPKDTIDNRILFILEEFLSSCSVKATNHWFIIQNL
jgi:hypothetical protein